MSADRPQLVVKPTGLQSHTVPQDPRQHAPPAPGDGLDLHREGYDWEGYDPPCLHVE
jgi:hypothetical protein